MHSVEARLARFLLAQLGATVRDAGERKPLLRLGMSQTDISLIIAASRPKINAAFAVLEEKSAIRRAGKDLACDLDRLARLAGVEISRVLSPREHARGMGGLKLLSSSGKRKLAMTAALFRQEAIDAHMPKLLGDVTLATPLPLKACVAFLAIAAVGLAGFVATGSYARKAHAPGFIAAHAGVANIVAPRAGVIEKIFVQEGATVRKGDPLIAVRVEQNALDGAGADSAMLETLRRQNSQIEEQIALEQDKAEATVRTLNAQIVGIDADLAVMTQQKALLAQKTALAEADVASIAGLVARHVVAQPELNRRRDAVLSARQAELDLQRARAAKVAEQDGKRDDLAQLPRSVRQAIVQLNIGRTENQLKIQQIEAQRGYLITAPKDGRVSALQAWTGRTIDANAPQMSVAPIDDVVTAELFVPADAIGSIAPGQSVNLDLASFPYQKFGFVDGVVDTVSYTLLKPDQMVGPVTLATPAYRVAVKLKQQTIRAYGQDVALKADMQVAADIVSDRRSLLDWLIDPLLAALRKSS